MKWLIPFYGWWVAWQYAGTLDRCRRPEASHRDRADRRAWKRQMEPLGFISIMFWAAVIVVLGTQGYLG